MFKENRMLFRLVTSFILFVFVNISVTPAEKKAVISSKVRQVSDTGVFRQGWWLSDPYQYLEKNGGVESLTGLDVVLVNNILKKAGYSAEYKSLSWAEHVESLRTGGQDMAAGATYTLERDEFVHYSKPYRREDNGFFVRKGDKSKLGFAENDVEQFLENIKEKKIAIGVVNGFVYADPAINDYINDPANAKLVVKSENVNENIKLLMLGKIQGFLEDRVVAATAIWKQKYSSEMEEVFLGIGVPISFMFSEKTVSLKVVKRINKAIEDFKQSGEYAGVVSEYLFPVLLLQTVEAPWFFFMELAGVLSLLISGLFLAYKERMNLFGALVMGAFSMSGSALRDVLVNRPKLGILLSPVYSYVVVFSVIGAYILMRIWSNVIRKTGKGTMKDIGVWLIRHEDQMIDFVASFGVAAFTVTGVVMATVSKLEPLWLWGPVLSVVTATGGIIARSLLLGTTGLRLFYSDFLGEIPILWGLFFSVGISMESEMMNPEKMFWWIMASVFGAFLSRIAVLYYKFKGISFGETPGVLPK